MSTRLANTGRLINKNKALIPESTFEQTTEYKHHPRHTLTVDCIDTTLI